MRGVRLRAAVSDGEPRRSTHVSRSARRRRCRGRRAWHVAACVLARPVGAIEVGKQVFVFQKSEDGIEGGSAVGAVVDGLRARRRSRTCREAGLRQDAFGGGRVGE